MSRRQDLERHHVVDEMLSTSHSSHELVIGCKSRDMDGITSIEKCSCYTLHNTD